MMTSSKLYLRKILLKQIILLKSQLFMVCLLCLSFSSCGNPKGEDGVSTLSISIDSGVTGNDYQACVYGLSQGSDYGCVSNNDNTSYVLQKNQQYMHDAGTFDLKLTYNGSDMYPGSYTIEVDKGKTGPNPAKGIDGKNKYYILEFKLNQAVLSVTED